MPKRSELRISKRLVDALPVGHTDAVFWDRDLSGFGIRVYPSGRKFYVVQCRGPAGIRRVSLGEHGGLTAEQARKRARAEIGRIKRGKRGKGAVPGRKPEAAPTVADLAAALPGGARSGELQRAHPAELSEPHSVTTSCRRWDRRR